MTFRGPDIVAVTFDFGNTLVPVDRAGLRRVVERAADAVCRRHADVDRSAFLDAWATERERQFREEVPQFREVDLTERLIRIFARLRGMSPPPPDERWNMVAAARHSDPVDVDWAVQAYSAAFVDELPPAAGVAALLQRLAAERDLAILSNWPLASTVDRYAEAHGWSRHLRAIVVSQRVGTIKPHPAIFDAARTALGRPRPGTMLHVGDDWAADVVGAAAAGWRTAWIRTRPEDSPLPSSARDDAATADLVLDAVTDVEHPLAG